MLIHLTFTQDWHHAVINPLLSPLKDWRHAVVPNTHLCCAQDVPLKNQDSLKRLTPPCEIAIS